METDELIVPICQSCGMPMEKPEDFGTNADESQNDDYCCYCFQEGKFTWPDATLEQFSQKQIDIAKNMGIPEEDAKTMAEDVLPKLKRWQQ